MPRPETIVTEAALGEYEIAYEPTPDKMRAVVRHTRCEAVVVSLTAARLTMPMHEVLDRMRSHDCSIAGLVVKSPESVKKSVRQAASLLDGADVDAVDDEYMRALSELVSHMLGVPNDRRDEVADHLWRMAQNTTGGKS